MKELSLHLLDLAENSTAAGATRIVVSIRDSLADDLFAFRIEDNGCGMTDEFLARVTDPYTTSRTTRKVGLGLPLVKMNAEHCDGHFAISSKVGEGTVLEYSFRHSHWDRPPMGDLAGTLVMLLSQHEGVHWIIRYTTDADSYTLDTDDLHEALGDMPLGQLQVVRFVKEMVAENLQAIGARQ